MTEGAGGVERSSAGTPPRWTVWVGYMACAWALAFAVAHYYWAFGGVWLVGRSGADHSRELLASEPWYYWTSWMTLGTVFVSAGLFPLALSVSRCGAPPRWMREGLAWGTCAVLVLLVAALALSDGPSWTQAPFLLCAAGLALVRFRYGAVPRWALLAATGVLGLGMALYGAVGIGYLSPWGPWWLLGGTLFLATARSHYRGPRDRGPGAG